jgi:hypothetical protein
VAWWESPWPQWSIFLANLILALFLVFSCISWLLLSSSLTFWAFCLFMIFKVLDYCLLHTKLLLKMHYKFLSSPRKWKGNKIEGKWWYEMRSISSYSIPLLFVKSKWSNIILFHPFPLYFIVFHQSKHIIDVFDQHSVNMNIWYVTLWHLMRLTLCK